MPTPVRNPPNPWHSQHIQWLDAPPAAELHVYEERARTLLSRNDSPDLPFRYSLNPYRGCYHGCAYCYARPSHQYLDWGAGTDFERRLVVKMNAPELLRAELTHKRWVPQTIALSGNTDCYQPLEASYQLTRRCLEVCVERNNPVSIITKGALIRRDIDVLQSLHSRSSVHVFISIPFDDAQHARAMEPYASTIDKRFDAMRALSDAGIPTGIAVAPLIPGLNDASIPNLLQRAHDAGATRAFYILLRLASEVQPGFDRALVEHFPDRAAKVQHALDELREGDIAGKRYGTRMIGQGPRWDALQQLFSLHARRLGFAIGEQPTTAPLSTLNPRQDAPIQLGRKPAPATQLTLDLGSTATTTT